MRSLTFLPSIMAILVLAGCAGSDRINQNMDTADVNYDAGRRQIEKLKNAKPVLREASQQWVNREPIKVLSSNHAGVPSCAITINRQGSISLNEISQRISSECHIPVFITPDARQSAVSIGSGVTHQIQGDIPPPDINGMLPLASFGKTAPSAQNQNGQNSLESLFWEGALSGLLDTVTSRMGLSWKYEHGRIVVFYLDTRSFPVTFMDSKAEFNSKVVSGTTTTSGNGDGAISGDGNTSTATTMEIKSSLYADLEDAIKSMLTPGLGRMFLSSGMLTVTDSPLVLDTVDSFIKERNKELNRQVVLNVQVLSVEKRNKDQLGIDWKAVFNSGSIGLSLSSGLANAAENSLTGGVSIIDGKLAGSKGFIRALSEQAKVSIMTQQSSTTTNMTALPMQVAEQEDYVSKITTESTANVGTSTSITPATITTGFNMTLLPYIMPNSNDLQLQFSISLSDPPTRRTFTSGENTVELLNTKLKTVNQRVNMRSGQTIVLSGFQQSNQNGSKQGVGQPWFFGLGGGQQGDASDTMLVILITPIIL
ncbi:PilN family type IVB pilus formation outer membrane protein [Morganella morganii]|nr:PilN family type IVB pilus formation outer membrane protein [Salmonella enterica subsp. enterica serovar Hadar]